MSTKWIVAVGGVGHARGEVFAVGRSRIDADDMAIEIAAQAARTLGLDPAETVKIWRGSGARKYAIVPRVLGNTKLRWRKHR